MLEWGRKSGDVRPILRDGDVVARVRPMAIRDHATVDIDGTAWSLYARRDELFGAQADASEPTLRATKPARRAWTVEADRTAYRIERFGLPRSRYTVVRSGVEIGSSGTAGPRRRRPTLDVDAATPLEHQLFLLWVAFIMRGRPGVRARRNTYGGGHGTAGGSAAPGGFGGLDGGVGGAVG